MWLKWGTDSERLHGNAKCPDMQGSRQTGRQAYRVWAQLHSSVRCRKTLQEEKQRECICFIPSELRRGGLWAGWQITGHSCCHGDCRGWRRWITHQRSSVNHQSPLTFHHRHRSPTPRTRILTHTHALEEDTAQNLAGDEFCWRINSNSVRTPPPLIACSSLSRPLFLSFFSHSHISLYLSFHWQPSFLSPSCSFLTFFFSSLHLCVLLVTELISSPLCFVPERYISLLCLAGHFATQHHRASKSLLTF